MITDDAFPVEPWHVRETHLDLNVLAQSESLFDYQLGESTRTFTDLNIPTADVTVSSLPAPAVANAKTLKRWRRFFPPSHVSGFTWDRTAPVWL